MFLQKFAIKLQTNTRPEYSMNLKTGDISTKDEGGISSPWLMNNALRSPWLRYGHGVYYAASGKTATFLNPRYGPLEMCRKTK
jgi:hypothetical protein